MRSVQFGKLIVIRHMESCGLDFGSEIIHIGDQLLKPPQSIRLGGSCLIPVLPVQEQGGNAEYRNAECCEVSEKIFFCLDNSIIFISCLCKIYG